MGHRIHVNKCAYTGAREVQQDAIAITGAQAASQAGMLAVLSDGIGGMRDGEKFSRIAVDAMQKNFESSGENDDLCARLVLAYQAARTAAREICGDPEDPIGGATVVAAAIRGGCCAFLSVGDSRIYLMRGGGLILLNREQTLGVTLDEYAALGYISDQDAEGNTRRKSLTNHLCEPRDKAPDVCAEPFRLRIGDRLALLSDGVFSALSEDEILKAMQGPVQEISARMIDMVKQKALPKQDNSSVVAIAVMNRKQNTTERRGGK